MRMILLGGIMLVSAVGLHGGPMAQTARLCTPIYRSSSHSISPPGRRWARNSCISPTGSRTAALGRCSSRPDPYPETTTETPPAIQELLDAQGRVVERRMVGVFVYSADHAHWHLADVARFELRIALDGGKHGLWGDVVREWDKETMCLLDFYKLDDPAAEKGEYAECAPRVQGISPGWVDQYYKAVRGSSSTSRAWQQGRTISSARPTPERRLLERTADNNAAWVSFQLTREPGGPPRLVLLGALSV